MPLETQGICPLLQVFDMPTSVRFYRDILGFEVFRTSQPRTPDDFDWCWLKRSHGTELMLNTAYDFEDRPPAPDPAHLHAHKDTILYFGCPKVDEAYRYLIARGLNLQEPKVTHYGMKQLYLNDPDGFGICFQWAA
jgi:catechol 2,3-dioxygenase-like lactoylglutathione lyase family enzyme